MKKVAALPQSSFEPETRIEKIHLFLEVLIIVLEQGKVFRGPTCANFLLIFGKMPLVWFWPLFFVLVAIGLLATRSRESSIIPYFFYPLYGLSAANAIGGLVHAPINWEVFSVAYLIGVAFAFRWQDSLILERTGWRMKLQGDRVTILILMVIFFSNFVNGFLAAAARNLRDPLAFTVIFAGIIGACSGSFTGRALRVVTLKSRSSGESRLGALC